MAHQLFVALLASVLLFSICCTITIASDSPTTFVQETCNDATYTNLCLNILVPNADRINGSPKKAARLAIGAIQPQIQSTSDNIINLSQQPQLWSREVNALSQCSNAISGSFSGVLNALQATNKLGGGSKGFKEAKRLSIENDVQSVIRATNSCTSTLQTSRARDFVINRANNATELLVQLATNAFDLVHHMEF